MSGGLHDTTNNATYEIQKKYKSAKLDMKKDMNIREKIQILKYKISDINAISVEQNKTVFAAGGGASVAFEV